ncbi:MAG: class I SAM-dependent methyltransferase [Patescibacteria group bacterium]
MKKNLFVDLLARQPALFNWLRRLLENNFRAHRAAIKRYFHLDGSSKIVDVGCGTGEFAPLFSGFSYTGVDIDETYIAYARKHYQGEFIVSDANRIPFPDDSFTYGVIIGLLHHLGDDDSKRVLSELRRVVKPSGGILIMEDVRRPGDGAITKLLHALDKGGDIRTREEYLQLISTSFAAKEDFRMQSGLCPYQVFSIINEK